MPVVPLPAFAAEMGLPEHRAKLWLGIRSGYAVALAFALLAALGDATELVPLTPTLAALIALKLVVNTLAWLALRRGVLVLELSGLNLLADIVAMTGAIYATGGVQSPLLPIYGIELTVIALLTNVGVTVGTGALTFASYAAMVFGIRAGVLETPRSLVEAAGGVSDLYLAMTLLFVAFVIGLPTGFAASILRQLREKEAALRARTEQLVEAGRARSQFMANVTHELRTPIHGICGLSDLLESGVYGPVTERQREAARDVKGSALSLLRLIDDLLTLAREDAGRLEHRPADVDLGELLAGVVSTLGFLRGTRPLEVRLEAPEQLPVLFTDRAKLAQILVNLLANAVKFTPDGGQVTLRARVLPGEPARVELAVEDTGIGIPQDELPRIFEPFRQVDGTTERRYGGAGLGLALVQRLTHLLGGSIAVRSAPGEGSAFTVTLPVRGPAAAPRPSPPPPSVERPGG
jgi:signal transduction histidine kinase